MDLSFYRDKKVLVTGHTGFKGSWLLRVLLEAGAFVCGYALEPPTDPSLFAMSGVAAEIINVTGDVRDLDKLRETFEEFQPEIVIHMAAQPLVRESYRDPVGTYAVNVMGTVNVCECVRLTPSVKSFLNVTTDKVYLNLEQERGYVETDVLDGYDPYSNSKSCSELVTASYVRSFFSEEAKKSNPDGNFPAVSTARAGNVIGGGDFAAERLVPDCVRAVEKGEEIVLRNPYAVRPFQHVLEPLFAYLMIAEAQYKNKKYCGSYNVGPDDTDCRTTGNIADIFCNIWNEKYAGKMINMLGTGAYHTQTFNTASWKDISEGGPHEAGLLKLDCTKLKETFGWKPVWSAETAIDKIVEWTAVWMSGGDVTQCMVKQIREFME